MDNFSLQDFQPYIFIIAGLGILLYGFLKKNKSKNISENGLKTEGIIFEMTKKPNYSTSFSNNVYDVITVRFVTNKLEWITSEIKNDSSFFYTGQYKVGDKVEVIYDANNPNNFIILTKQSEKTGRLIIIVAGLVFFLIGLFEFLKLPE